MYHIRNNGCNMLFVCVTVGLVLLASKYRDNVFRSVKQICHSIVIKKEQRKKIEKVDKDINKGKDVKVSLDKVILADSIEKCNYAIQRLRGNLSNGILGFDCEWVNEGPISLLQLATYNGTCVLFRLGKIGCVPPKLKELLGNRRLLKVGVASYEDSKKLSNDYGCTVSGTLDLRTLASRLNLPSPKSLAALCMQYLHIEMDKILEVRCGDWNADNLTDEQISYAAYDAQAAVLIYHEIIKQAKRKLSFWETVIFYIKNMLNDDKDEKSHGLPCGVIDERFKVPRDTNSNSSINNIKKNSQVMQRNIVLSNKQLPTRNKPLYHNCYLQAPDGETLCTCDRKKAEWYLSKQLGEIVEEDPLTVRLKFEPSGRAMGEVGQYYTQVKENQCVVCGSKDKFIRKNVVPREYRKYFPLVMKAHQSHDVLLLCPTCHEISNMHDLQLRRKLADMCDAPLCGPQQRAHGEQPRMWQKHRTAVKVLRENFAIPLKRRKELEMYIKNATGHHEVTPAVLDTLHERFEKMPPQSRPMQKMQPHGLKVVEYYQKTDGGLVELEKLWREHFLNTMEPRFLPKLWSVSHNQERLYLRQTQNRIQPEDAKVAGLVN